ncbi:hypothetical protein [Gemmata sp.]|uniref:hypothetical protein n=1 Tax=Gemmata sp. TaxID=1914242 RepID=UPI003F72BF71
MWFVLGWLALAFGGMQVRHAANTGEAIGGYFWAVLFFAIAFWPRRPPAETEKVGG